MDNLLQKEKKENRDNISVNTWPEKIKWLQILVSYDTTSSKSNLALIHHIRDALVSLGLRPYLNAETNITHKANLFVTIPSASGSYKGGIVLSGHTDTVPVSGQKWQSDPFDLLDKIVENDLDSQSKSSFKKATLYQKSKKLIQCSERRLYGRGTCDMKGFIAVCLASIPKIIKLQLSIPIHIALSYDEEIGCLGVPSMIQSCQSRGINPALCIVGEPTLMLPVVAHKSVHSFLCQIYGHATHSSLAPQGVNAIEYAARIICKIRNITNNKNINKIIDKNFDIPFTTTQTGLITGGNSINTVPEYCEFSFEFRTILNHEAEILFAKIKKYSNELINEMREISEETDIKFTQLESIPALEPSNDPFLKNVLKNFSKEPHQRKVAYATEAGIFSQFNIPTIVCGPGSIKQAHRANEYISFSQLQKCENFLDNLLNFMDKNSQLD